jgi:tetratricopeptide (TPR) repeat protein
LEEAIAIQVQLSEERNERLTSVLGTLAHLCLHQGRYAKAESLATTALSIWEEEENTAHDDYSEMRETLQDAIFLQGRHAEAESLVHEELARAVAPADSANWLIHLGVILETEKRFVEAEKTYEDAYAVALRQSDPQTLVAAENSLASIYIDLGKYADAEPLLSHVIELAEDGVARLSTFELGTATYLLSASLGHQGKYDDAIETSKRATEIYERAEAKQLVVAPLIALGYYHRKSKAYEASEGALRQALGVQQELGLPDNFVQIKNLAIACSKQGKYAEADSIFTRALEVLNADDPEAPAAAWVFDDYAQHCLASGNSEKAEEFCLRSIAVAEKNFGPDHPDAARGWFTLGKVHAARGEHPTAETTFLRALEIRENSLTRDHPDVLEVISSMVDLYREMGKDARASELEARLVTARGDH